MIGAARRDADGQLTYTIDPAPGRGDISYREDRGPGADGTEHVGGAVDHLDGAPELFVLAGRQLTV
ncbi:hypothetical protein [Streptomyces sp. HO565]|uniref:hypothetical protein n=1 Tax=Streptomyces sp. HO565 TaxID=2857489 RepID=UPI0034DBCEE5